MWIINKSTFQLSHPLGGKSDSKLLYNALFFDPLQTWTSELGKVTLYSMTSHWELNPLKSRWCTRVIRLSLVSTGIYSVPGRVCVSRLFGHGMTFLWFESKNTRLNVCQRCSLCHKSDDLGLNCRQKQLTWMVFSRLINSFHY